MGRGWGRVVVRVVGTVMVCMGLSWCQDRPPPEPREARVYDVPFPRNAMECSSESGRAALRWIDRAQHRNFAYRSAVPRAELVEAEGPALTRPPERVHSIDAFGVYSDGKKLADLGGPLGGLAHTLDAITRLPHSFAISRDARMRDVLDVWSHSPQGDTLTLILRVPPDASEVEPVPGPTRARLTALVEAGADLVGQRRVAYQSARLNGVLEEAAATCAPLRTLNSARERTSYEDAHTLLGEDLVDAWVACGCGFDLEVLVAWYHGHHLGATPLLLTSRELRVDPVGGRPLAWSSFQGVTWAQAAPELLEATKQGFCIQDAPRTWCGRPGRAMLCQGACEVISSERSGTHHPAGTHR